HLPPGGMRMAAPRSRAMIGLRVLAVRMMTRWPSKQLGEKQFSKADAITLRDYPVFAAQRR
ncbi:FAD-binding monooxygenase, partial [Actinoplanes philippinensis]